MDFYCQLIRTPQTSYQTEYGQLLDLTTASEDVVDLDKFSLERYLSIPSCILDVCSRSNFKTPSYRGLQDCLLLLLPPRRPGNARVQRPLHRRTQQPLRTRHLHPHPPRHLLPDPGRLPRLLSHARGPRQGRHGHRRQQVLVVHQRRPRARLAGAARCPGRELRAEEPRVGDEGEGCV